jgi:hypothetical protein
VNTKKIELLDVQSEIQYEEIQHYTKQESSKCDVKKNYIWCKKESRYFVDFLKQK